MNAASLGPDLHKARWRRFPPLIAACVIATAPHATLAQSSLPDPALTPGAINPAVTQDDIESTICVRGWTRTVRPPRQYTEGLKREQIREGMRRIGGMCGMACRNQDFHGRELMDRPTALDLFAVTAMLVTYALEKRSPWFVLAFAGACVLGSAYGFLQGAWPFGLMEAIWAVVAMRRYRMAGRGEGP
jgi:hypothetical protein